MIKTINLGALSRWPTLLVDPLREGGVELPL